MAVAAAHTEARATVQWLIESSNCNVSLLSLPRDELAGRSAGWDSGPVAQVHGLDFCRTSDINDDSTLAWLEKRNLDALIVLGWSQILRSQVLACAPWVIGAHASPLPRGRGGSPVNWAIINHEQQWGNTLMRLSAQLDGGDIVGQSLFPIGLRDTVADVYAHVEASNVSLVQAWLADLDAGQVACTAQVPTDEKPFRRRTPEDGRIDWTESAGDIDALVRGVTRPYPGAWCVLGDAVLNVWAAVVHGNAGESCEPGVIAEIDAAGCPLVRCGRECLLLTSVTCSAGQPLPVGAIKQGDRLG